MAEEVEKLDALEVGFEGRGDELAGLAEGG